MSSKSFLVRWFLIGMGYVIGSAPTANVRRSEGTEIEAIGRDFQAVGADISAVMRKHPATVSEAKSLGLSVQLNLAGLK